jgi:murein DD-endopeptidase MepM/ murein hydrolase activator NlpD
MLIVTMLAPAGLAAAVPVAGPAVAAAPTNAEYERITAQLAEMKRRVAAAEARERALKKSIQDTSSKRRQLQSQLDELRRELDEAQRLVDQSGRRTQEVDATLAEKTVELDGMQSELAAARRAFTRRAAQVYMSGPASFFGFMLGSTRWSDLATRVRILESIFDRDDSRMRALQEAGEGVRVQRQQIAALRELRASELRLVTVKRDQVSTLHRVIAVRSVRLDAQIREQQTSLQDVQASKAEYLRQQRLLEQDSRRIAALLGGRTGGTASVSKGNMVWPVSGPISSPFGWRTHPVYKDRRFHAGIDIAAPMGQPIAAAASGTVISAGMRSGYGNMVVVDHGGGLATVYAHMSSIGAREGASLAQGQQLGRVGCTGVCTGPHLHFEVRQNGEPKNPTLWLS